MNWITKTAAIAALISALMIGFILLCGGCRTTNTFIETDEIHIIVEDVMVA